MSEIEAERVRRKGPTAKRAVRGGGGEPNQRQARSLNVDADGGGGSSTPGTAPVSHSRVVVPLVDVTVDDPGALDCLVCYLPLETPIFQCEVGHTFCSRCRNKLQTKCPVCKVVTSSYRRCHAMERVMESIRIPCPYAAHGCAVRPFYNDQESHRLVCKHAPCHCPDNACRFVGSTAAFLDHVNTAHKWPCISTVKTNDDGYFNVDLHDGFNLILADCSIGNKNKCSTSSVQCLLLLVVERQQNDRFITVHWIDPHAADTSGSQGSTSKQLECELLYSLLNNIRCREWFVSDWLISDSQGWKFIVFGTNLSDGLPADCFQVVVPKTDCVGIQIKVRIGII